MSEQVSQENVTRALVEGIAAKGHVTVEIPLTLPDGTQGVGYAAIAPDVSAATLAALGRVMEAALRMDGPWTEGSPRR